MEPVNPTLAPSIVTHFAVGFTMIPCANSCISTSLTHAFVTAVITMPLNPEQHPMRLFLAVTTRSKLSTEPLLNHPAGAIPSKAIQAAVNVRLTSTDVPGVSPAVEETCTLVAPHGT